MEIHLFITAITPEVLVSPKETLIKEHGSAVLILLFINSYKIKVWWENEDGCLPDGLRRHISTLYKSKNDFIVSLSYILHFM